MSDANDRSHLYWAANGEIELPLLLAICVYLTRGAGHLIRDIIRHNKPLEAVDKSDGAKCAAGNEASMSDPQTIADRRAQHFIVATLQYYFGPNLCLVAEEGDLDESSVDISTEISREELLHILDEQCTASWPLDLTRVDSDRICVFIDPLDATKQFARTNYDVVTTLIGITLDEHPIGGVIGLPFLGWNIKEDEKDLQTRFPTREIYGIVGAGVFGQKDVLRSLAPASVSFHQYTSIPNGHGDMGAEQLLQTRKFRAVVSGRDQRVFRTLQMLGVTKDNILYKSGAGRKFIDLLLGVADLYVFQKHYTSRWDTAAGEGLLRVLGGSMLSLQGDPYKYERKTWAECNVQAHEATANGVLCTAAELFSNHHRNRLGFTASPMKELAYWAASNYAIVPVLECQDRLVPIPAICAEFLRSVYNRIPRLLAVVADVSSVLNWDPSASYTCVALDLYWKTKSRFSHTEQVPHKLWVHRFRSTDGCTRLARSQTFLSIVYDYGIVDSGITFFKVIKQLPGGFSTNAGNRSGPTQDERSASALSVAPLMSCRISKFCDIQEIHKSANFAVKYLGIWQSRASHTDLLSVFPTYASQARPRSDSSVCLNTFKKIRSEMDKDPSIVAHLKRDILSQILSIPEVFERDTYSILGNEDFETCLIFNTFVPTYLYGTKTSSGDDFQVIVADTSRVSTGPAIQDIISFIIDYLCCIHSKSTQTNTIDDIVQELLNSYGHSFSMEQYSVAVLEHIVSKLISVCALDSSSAELRYKCDIAICAIDDEEIWKYFCNHIKVAVAWIRNEMRKND